MNNLAYTLLDFTHFRQGIFCLSLNYMDQEMINR